MSSPTSKQKWYISLWSLLFVIIIFNPITFKITNVLGKLHSSLATEIGGSPTAFGWVLHWVVFLLVIRAVMEIKLPGTEKQS